MFSDIVFVEWGDDLWTAHYDSVGVLQYQFYVFFPASNASEHSRDEHNKSSGWPMHTPSR